MVVELRDTTAEDARLIHDLRCDPRLRGMQYAPSWFERPDTIYKLLYQEPALPYNGLLSSTIIADGTFVGDILEFYRTTRKKRTVTLSWNIVPEQWGKGIAPAALKLLLDERFSIDSKLRFRACCFSSNSRCIRVMQKLHFKPGNLTMYERILHFCCSMGKHRVLCFGLTFNEWKRFPHNSG